MISILLGVSSPSFASLTIFLRKSTRFQQCDFAFILSVHLISNDNDGDIRTSEQSRITQPGNEMIVRITTEQEGREKANKEEECESIVVFSLSLKR